VVVAPDFLLRFFMKLIRLGCLMTCLMTVPTLASSQVKPAERAVVLDELTIEVVTATKTAKKAEDVPAVIEVVTAADLRRRGYRHLADLLNDLPDNHEDRGNWGIGEPVHQHSGMGFRFDTGQNMLLLFNGFRLNAFLPGNRFGGEEYLLGDIERVEIVRGPGSALYGANAFTTVVNVITRSDSGEGRRTNVAVDGSAPQAFATSGATSTALGGGFLSASFRGARDIGHQLVVSNALFGDSKLRDGVRHALDAQLSYSRGPLTVYGKSTNQRRDAFTGFNGVNPSDNDDLALSTYSHFVGAQYVANLRDRLQLKGLGEWHQDNWTEVALIPMFQTNATGDALLRDAGGAPMLDTTIAVERGGRMVRTPFVIDGQGADTRTLEGELQLTWNYRNANNAILGANVSQDRVLSAVRPSEIQLDPFAIVAFRSFTDDANNWLADTHASRLTVGFYAQGDYDVGPFSFTLGGRLDHYTGAGALDQVYTEFNPRGGIVYKDSVVGVVKLLFGSATRVPNGFETLSTVTILGTPTNRPEKIKTLQAQWLRAWGSHLRTELGSFYSRIDNHLVTDAEISEEMAAQGFIGQFRNVAEGQVLESQGLNGRASVRAGKVEGFVNFTRYFNTNDGSGAAIPYVPMTMVNANVNATVGAVNVNVGANYRGAFSTPDDDPRRPVRSYVGMTSNVVFAPPTLPWELSVGVRNALNQGIRAPSSSRDFVNHFPGRGRELMTSIRYTF
jgi:outer membrane receptor protein involved in Fe transport